MIYEPLETLIVSNLDDFMIPADNVANVIDRHSLSNALLILSQVSYNLIPVLNSKSQFVGLLSIPMMIKAVMTIERIEIERLDSLVVEDVMQREVVSISLNASLSEVLQHLIDHSFVCVVDERGTFLGMITRKKVLQRLTYLLHETSSKKELAKFIHLLQTGELPEDEGDIV